MCRERITKALAFEKGVKRAELDLETQIVTILYKNQETEPDRFKKVIAGAGYDADDVRADQKAYDKLPDCCKKPDDPAHILHEGHGH